MSADKVTGVDGKTATGICGTCGASTQPCSICHSKEMVWSSHDCQSDTWYCKACYARNFPPQAAPTIRTDVGVAVEDFLGIFMQVCTTMFIGFVLAVIAVLIFFGFRGLFHSLPIAIIFTAVALGFIAPVFYKRMNRR